jgi:tetratricopeptide (TPR) repeat protein
MESTLMGETLMRRYARTLIMEARDEPARLLANKKFWKLAVFDEFLQEITARLYTDGTAALALALYGPAFAKLVATQTNTDLNVLLVRAYGRLGSAYRVVGRFADADAAFNHAESLPAPLTEHAETFRRRAYLRVYQGRREEAYDDADQAVQIYKASEDFFDRHLLGTALLARGYTHYHSNRLGPAAVDLSAAVGLINHRNRPRIYYDALHNLSVIMVEAMVPAQLGQVLKNLDASYNRFVGAKRHIAKHKLNWLKALGHKRFGATRHAERLLKKAFNGFVDMEASTEMSMIALDIALLFIEEGRLGEARFLAANAYKIASALGMDADALAALKLWKDAEAAELTPEFLATIRVAVIEHAKPYGLEAHERPTAGMNGAPAVDPTARL